MAPPKRSWNICPNFHGMNDFAHDGQGGFTRSYTYAAECYATSDQQCLRQGRCVIATDEIQCPCCGYTGAILVVQCPRCKEELVFG